MQTSVRGECATRGCVLVLGGASGMWMSHVWYVCVGQAFFVFWVMMRCLSCPRIVLACRRIFFHAQFPLDIRYIFRDQRASKGALFTATRGGKKRSRGEGGEEEEDGGAGTLEDGGLAEDGSRKSAVRYWPAEVWGWT